MNIMNISEQYMFGPYMMIIPVFNYDNTTNIYIPKKYNIWYNFWSGDIISGGQYLENITIPLSEIPIYIHEGSILIMSQISQWANQLYPWNELEVRLYKGENATFIYFNDDGKDRLSLENKKFTTITFTWIDSKNELIIGQRDGKYDGMVSNITMNIVIVSKGYGVGVNVTTNPNKTVVYTGSAMTINF